MKRPSITVVLLVVVVIVAGYFAVQWRKADKQLLATSAWTHAVMDSLSSTMEFPNPPYLEGMRDSLYWQWVATGAQLRVRQAQNVVRHWVSMRSTLLDEADLIHLKSDGLDDPPLQLRESLIGRTDLIPYPGELGGTMRFEEDSIVLLDPPYAFATFEDGHVQGSMLLQYQVSSGKIDWQRLWATLE